MDGAARLSWPSVPAREIIRQLNDDNQWKVTANCSRSAAFGKRVITLCVYAASWHVLLYMHPVCPPITKSLIRAYINMIVISSFYFLIN